MARALAFHLCGLGWMLAPCHLWVELVVGARPCSEGFSPSSQSGYSPSTNINTPNFNSIRK